LAFAKGGDILAFAKGGDILAFAKGGDILAFAKGGRYFGLRKRRRYFGLRKRGEIFWPSQKEEIFWPSQKEGDILRLFSDRMPDKDRMPASFRKQQNIPPPFEKGGVGGGISILGLASFMSDQK
jgi:hypothetical protein